MKRSMMRRCTAAKLLANLIVRKCQLEANTVTVIVDGDLVLVTWEGGPFEWAPALTGGSSIYAGESGRYSEANPWFAQVERIAKNKRVFFECQNSFQICVWED